ncbi:MAG TPA: hypothetical protein VJ672_17800 [Gemmatimonadaceae bacterium]|nr:hypothetical protein [Gemmatimonadaceae bacterium]
MYIDPSAGSLILQLVAAGVIAVSATLTSVRAKIRALFRRNSKSQNQR